MITILCSGSRGDFQPYIALAQQLKKQGKAVRITASKNFAAMIKSYGIDVFPIQADIESLNIDPKIIEAASSSDNPLKMFLTFNKMKKFGQYTTNDYFQACQQSELIIYHPGCAIGYFAAQYFNIPCVLAAPFPLNKTNDYLSVILYGRVPKNTFTKKLSYFLLQKMLWMASAQSIKHFWNKQFGNLPQNFKAPFESHLDAQHPAIISGSNFVFKRPDDWNPHIHQYGYWFVEEQNIYTPDKKLKHFLDQGEKPIYIGFGSITALNKDNHLIELVVETAKKLNKRVIISGMGQISNLPDHILTITEAPHTWLFEQVSLVCHHGGAGTTASALRAGVAQVIIPFSNDQFAWAQRVYELGVSPRPIPHKKLSLSGLKNAITEALSTEKQQAAASLGEKITTEHGAAHAAQLIIQTLQNDEEEMTD